ncbi:MAG: hypothetical protein KA084_01420 [Brachymonas sp.]|jgi:hypothetical protein|nr:hypothetical protein [Brachymonas sp.]
MKPEAHITHKPSQCRIRCCWLRAEAIWQKKAADWQRLKRMFLQNFRNYPVLLDNQTHEELD